MGYFALDGLWDSVYFCSYGCHLRRDLVLIFVEVGDCFFSGSDFSPKSGNLGGEAADCGHKDHEYVPVVEVLGGTFTADMVVEFGVVNPCCHDLLPVNGICNDVGGGHWGSWGSWGFGNSCDDSLGNSGCCCVDPFVLP